MTMPSGFFLKKKPPLAMLETPRELENRSNRQSIPGCCVSFGGFVF
jgi:hypothetical protein